MIPKLQPPLRLSPNATLLYDFDPLLQVGATYVSGSFDKAASYLRTGEATNQPMQLSDGFKRR